VPSRPGDIGLAVLAGHAAATAGPVTVATTEAWARSVRRFARVAVWTVPAYAVVYGVASFGWYGDLVPYLDHGVSPRYGGTWHRYTHQLGAPLAAWLGLVAMVALAALLIGVRSRRTAAVGLGAGMAGTALLLPAGGLATFPAAVDDRVYGRVFGLTVAAGAALYSLGWFLLGLAVLRSRILNRGDGILLLVAAPLLGLGGALAGPLRTVGLLLVLAAGIGIGVTAVRLVPAGGTVVHHARPAES
jgi:hypothetical protein